MNQGKAPYEVEIRFHFESEEEAYERIPFLKDSLQRKNDWVTDTLGKELFSSDRLLRTADVFYSNQSKRYLGLKGPDIGRFANIRQELEEEVTYGITGSTILKTLGGSEGSFSCAEVTRELERLGYQTFMSFAGENCTGYHQPLDIYTKLLSCLQIRYPLMVELEKVAETEEEAETFEEDLRELTRELNLLDRMVRKEPPTLLYEKLFGTENL